MKLEDTRQGPQISALVRQALRSRRPYQQEIVETVLAHADSGGDRGLVVLDEAHHYVNGNEWFEVLRRLKFFDAQGEALHQSGQKMLLGFTATPDRLSGNPLVSVYGPHLLYTRDINYI